LGELEFDGTFPETLPQPLQNAAKNFDRFELIRKLNDLNAMGLNKCVASIFAVVPTICLAINRNDFLRFMTPEMLRALFESSFIFSVEVT
jgi:hypothetical protein